MRHYTSAVSQKSIASIEDPTRRSFDCVLRKRTRQTPLRMTTTYYINFGDS
jgi:hypothetical protein